MRQYLALGVAAATLLLGARGTQDAVANGDTRSISIRHMHTKEETTVTFKRDGRYVAEALETLNWALRDWRIDEPIKMDPRLFDLAWEVQRAVGSEQPFHVVSAYRSPGTNSMLRRRSRGVAKHSQHTMGKAMDFYLPDTPTARLREAGMRLQRGGVGFYPGAHTPFVHLDAGSVRSWPRMTRDQLVRLFPDEKTVHLPADGHPLAGYELAKADVLARGGAVAGYEAADLDEGAIMSSGRKSLWASLFGGDEEEVDARPTRGGRRPAAKPRPATQVAAADFTSREYSNANDAWRFAGAAAPEPAARNVMRERTERLAPKPAESESTQVAALAPNAVATPAVATPAAGERRPSLIEAPLPLARPRGLSVPVSPVDAEASAQLAALSASAGALSFAPPAAAATDQKLALAFLPPRRPDAMTAPVDAAAMGKATTAPVPPARPVAFANLTPATLALADLRGSETAQPQSEGRLVTVSHPLPPGRPRAEGVAVAAFPAPIRPSASAPTPIVAQYDADRSGLDSLFAAVARTSPVREGTSVTIAKARARATPTSGAAPIQGPSPAAALGFSHAEPSDAKTGSFSGPAVRALPTNFIQN